MKLSDLYALKGAATSQPLGLDPAEAVRVPAGVEAEVDSLPGVDPLSFFVGRVERTIGEDPGKSSFMNTTKLIDRRDKVIRSATGQLTLDYGNGLATINAPCAQGAAGFLRAAGTVDLGDVSISLQDDYGSVMVVSLDGQAAGAVGQGAAAGDDRGQVLRLHDRTAPAAQGQGGAQADTKRIVSVGQPPLLVRKMDGAVSFKRADAASLKVTALDFNGYARQQLQGGAAHLALLPDCLYYIIEK